MRVSIIILLCIFITACQNKQESIPKPVGFMRVDLPEHSYQSSDSLCPYQFEFAKRAKIQSSKKKKHCNRNIFYPQYDAKVHLSYFSIDSAKMLYNLIEDARDFAYEHQVKASSIKTEMVVRPKDKVYGLKYEITGDAASPMQFYITDSTRHFLRGALYFRTKPNYDSLRPYIDYIHQDIRHLINSAHWE